MYKKIIIACSIFVLMFIGGWFLNEQTKREYYYSDYELEDMMSIKNMSTMEISNQYRVFPAFESREYIRVNR